MSPAGTDLLPFAPTAIDVEVESNVSTTLEQLLVAHSWNVTLPVSCVSGSENVALSVGVCVVTVAASAGPTRAGIVGAWSAVLLVICAFATVPLAAAFPVGVAVSRTTLPVPGCV